MGQSSVRPVRRLLISRSSASYRQLLNEAELFEALAPIGFERVWLEELPFVQQVALFQSAEAIVARTEPDWQTSCFVRQEQSW